MKQYHPFSFFINNDFTVKTLKHAIVHPCFFLSYIRIPAYIISLFCTVLSLSACHTDDDISSKNDNTTNQYCNTFQEPFNYTSCEVQQELLLEKKHKLALKLFWREGNDNTNKQAKPLLTFDNLLQSLPKNQNIIFATNAGMYNSKYAPIGYTVINNKQVLSLNLNEGAGNFHLMPNGVFWWDEHGYYITESNVMSEIIQSGTKPKYASQSGPLLVINGKIHPKFKKDSTSKKIRNGVGVCANGMIKFVTTNVPVNFYSFASLYKDTLHCDNALFFDGGIASALVSSELHRHDTKNMGVMVGLVEIHPLLKK